MILGNRDLIDILIDEFKASIHVKAHNDLTVMHYAAQNYSGYMSILILVKNHGFDVNVKSTIGATPLHFAIVKKEVKNVELLIRFGADVNAKDFLGQTPLHITVMRTSQDPDGFQDFKRIMKELLFNGANKSLKNDNGQTPYDLLKKIRENDVLEDSEYRSLHTILNQGE